MKDSNRKFDKHKVEALPDVSDQLDRLEASVNDLRRIMSGFLEKWGRLVIGCVILMALSSFAGALALVTLALHALG